MPQLNKVVYIAEVELSFYQCFSFRLNTLLMNQSQPFIWPGLGLVFDISLSGFRSIRYVTVTLDQKHSVCDSYFRSRTFVTVRDQSKWLPLY